jgi:D-alanyl-lipoteichoic acid acyltransferase DltB (MBOAT superfamily)
VEVTVGVFAYTLQIYYDFSAYSDIAIGTAALFGIKFKENFDRPYKANSLPDFWRRWHISLSNWLRDYLYIPLGGNRDGLAMTVRNVMITMILGGIWHGANWRMALWGLVHGVGLSLTRILWRYTGMPTGAEPMWRKATAWTLTFLSVMLARVYFRADSMDQAHAVFAGMIGSGLEAPNLTPQVLGVLALATAIHFGPSNLFDRISVYFVRAPIPLRAAGLLAIALVVKHLANFDVQPFIYTKF